jgi:hypothetical protein
MKSLRGFAAAVVFLLTLPIAVMCQMLVGDDEAETVVHAGLALGSALLSLAVFDFRTARWVAWIGSASTGALAIVFFLQGVSELIGHRSLSYLAFQVFWQQLEARLVDLFTFWCVATLLIDSVGKTRILGFVALSIVVGAKLCSYGLTYLGSSLDAEAPGLKLLYLLPFAWLVFETTKRLPSKQSVTST